MMKCIVTFYDNAKKAIVESTLTEKKISWAVIQAELEEEFLELSQMKFKKPDLSQEELNEYFNKLADDIDQKFRNLVHAA